MANAVVQGQVERILDESSAHVHSVIVQMEEPIEELRRVFEASTEALRRRQLTLSPRELGPVSADIIRDEGRLSRSKLEKLRSASYAASSHVVLANTATNITLEQMRSAGLDVLSSLLESDVVRAAMESATRRTKRKIAVESELPPGFHQSWSSRSAVLRMTRGELSKLPESVPNVSGVFPNGQVKLPPIAEVKTVPREIVENASSAWGVEKVGALAAWGAYGTRGDPGQGFPPIKVAVLDTGVDAKHPELTGKIGQWAEFDVNGVRISSQPHDSEKHGTHVCGTIAGSHPNAANRGHSYIGVAPDVELLVGLVLRGGKGSYFQIIAGMDWAIASGAEVINMSLGEVSLEADVMDIYTRSILNANLQGVPVVISIGNEGAQTSGAPGNDCFAFSVGATDYLDRPGGFSGGRTQIIRKSRFIPPDQLPLVYSKPEVSAPGVAVRSCVPGNRYETWNGTSMAAAHVSGALALLLAATDIRLVPAQRRAFVLQDLISSSVEEIGEAGRDHRFGFGRINVLRAIAFARDQGF